MKHVLKEYVGSDLVLNEYITPEGNQVLHLFIRYHNGRLNYTVSFETNRTHVSIDDHYKNALLETLKEMG
jgi:hypothetical protein